MKGDCYSHKRVFRLIAEQEGSAQTERKGVVHAVKREGRKWASRKKLDELSLPGIPQQKF